jgi:hypothetical protein
MFREEREAFLLKVFKHGCTRLKIRGVPQKSRGAIFFGQNPEGGYTNLDFIAFLLTSFSKICLGPPPLLPCVHL